MEKQQRRGSYPGNFRHGFSLAEIILALALVCILIVVFIEIILMGHFTVRQSSEMITASNIGQEVLERCRYLGYTRIPPGSTFDGLVPTARSAAYPDFPPVPYPKIMEQGVTYYLNTRVSDLPSTGTRVRKVEITVTWDTKSPFSYDKGGGGITRKNLTMVTLISEVY